MRIVNLYDINTPNVGDQYAGPGRYAAALGLAGHSWRTLDHASAADAFRYGDAVVIGGGGHLSGFYPWTKAFGDIPQDRWPRVVVWGSGTNYYDEPRVYAKRGRVVTRHGLKYPAWVADAAAGGALVGTRDAGTPYDWVPCASCMLPQLDELRATKPTRHAVVYGHRDHALTSDLEVVPNTVDLPTALAHLASAEVVVTNAYHGAYWATLLGRRVVLRGAFSNKFRFLKHPAAEQGDDETYGEAEARAVAYPSALEECRAATLAFAAKVRARFDTIGGGP